MGLSFTVSAGPRQRSHSRVRILTGLMAIFYCLRFEAPQHGGPGPPLYFPPETGWPGHNTGIQALSLPLPLAGL
jgi:hypothetical protein